MTHAEDSISQNVFDDHVAALIHWARRSFVRRFIRVRFAPSIFFKF